MSNVPFFIFTASSSLSCSFLVLVLEVLAKVRWAPKFFWTNKLWWGCKFWASEEFFSSFFCFQKSEVQTLQHTHHKLWKVNLERIWHDSGNVANLHKRKKLLEKNERNELPNTLKIVKESQDQKDWHNIEILLLVTSWLPLFPGCHVFSSLPSPTCWCFYVVFSTFRFGIVLFLFLFFAFSCCWVLLMMGSEGNRF